MERKRNRRLRVATFVILPAILALAAIVPAFLSVADDAGALDASEWETVLTALDTFVANQASSDADNDFGFTLDATTLKSRIDSNGDGVYLGEGDDAALNPVLVDVLDSQAEMIPTTATRSNWNTTSLQSASVEAIAGFVNRHEAAGFSTDVVVYCATGHTESAAGGGFGAVAGAGGLGGSSTPQVLALKWGRAGWGPGNFDKQYTRTDPPDATAAAVKPTDDFADATNAACSGITPAAELVRCTAEWALSTGVNGDPVGNGVLGPADANWDFANWQAIDLRPGGGLSVDGTMNDTLSIPVDTIFNTGLNFLNPAAPKKIFVGNTQHMAGMIATGAEMLGYDSGFLQWGLANYNNTLPEKYTGSAGFAQVPAAPPDLAPPILSNISVKTSSPAEITWTTDEPATSMVAFSKTAGGPYTIVNDTILHTSHSVTVNETGPFFFKVVSYDGMANGTSSEEMSSTAAGKLPATGLPAAAASILIMGGALSGMGVFVLRKR